MKVFTITEAAKEHGCRPRDISDLLWAGALDESRLVQIGIRRTIPADYMPAVRDVLLARGKIKAEQAAR
jgi:hypothetical protein